MLRGKRNKPYTIEGSTDIGGLSPWLGAKIWERYSDVVDGLEVIAWRWSTAAFLQSPVAMRLTRLHGQLGGLGIDVWDGAKVALYNHGMLLDDRRLFSLAQARQLDVLVHEPHAANGFRAALNEHFPSDTVPLKLWIENHIGGHTGLAEAEKLAEEYLQQGYDVHLMIDLAHYIEPAMQRTFRERWSTLVTEIQRLSNMYSVGVHFPIGDLAYDSIDVLSLTEVQLKDLQEALQQVQTVVFEYQSPLVSYMRKPQQRIQAVQTRLDQVLERLYRVGII